MFSILDQVESAEFKIAMEIEQGNFEKLLDILKLLQILFILVDKTSFLLSKRNKSYDFFFQ